MEVVLVKGRNIFEIIIFEYDRSNQGRWDEGGPSPSREPWLKKKDLKSHQSYEFVKLFGPE